MRVVLDTNGLYTTQAGVARYIRGLSGGLRKLARPDLTVSELAWPVENFEYRQPVRAMKTFYRELVWPRFAARRLLRQAQPHIFHSTALPLLQAPQPTANVITLHDLAVLAYPERFRRWHRYAVNRSLKTLFEAHRVICVSRFTAEEAAKYLKLPHRKMEVVHNGGDFHSSEPPPAEAAPGDQLPRNFFLFVGSLEPGKNLGLLREAYALAEAEKRPLPSLVIVGARWEGVAGEGAPPANWRYLGRQPDSVLVYLYRRAVGLVFPSKYEGFGLPVLEAMSLNCPVICSPVASLPEVGGSAVFYCDLNAAAYYRAMIALSSDGRLREDLALRGREQAAKFSWTRCARETAAVYEAAAGG